MESCLKSVVLLTAVDRAKKIVPLVHSSFPRVKKHNNRLKQPLQGRNHWHWSMPDKFFANFRFFYLGKGEVEEGFLIHFYVIFWKKTIASRTLQTAIHVSLQLQIPFLVCKVLRKSWGCDHIKEKNSRVTYISEGKSRFTPAHKFTNHSRLSLKFTYQIIILVLSQVYPVYKGG